MKSLMCILLLAGIFFSNSSLASNQAIEEERLIELINGEIERIVEQTGYSLVPHETFIFPPVGNVY